MKKIFALSALSIALSTPLMASNPAQGWYVGMTGIGSNLTNINFQSLNPFTLTTTIPVTFQYSVGGGASVQLGARIDQFRVEGQFLFNTNSLSHITINNYRFNKSTDQLGFRIKGQTNLWGLLLNGFYEFYTPDQETSFIPYVGLGVGISQLDTHNRFYLNNIEIPNTYFQSKKNAGIGQAIIGGTFLIDDYTTFGIDYRYMSTSNISNIHQRAQINTINLTFNFSFDVA